MNLGTLLGRKGTLLWTNKEVHVALNEGKIIQVVVRFIYHPLEVVARTIACCLHTFLEGGQDNLFCREFTRGNPFGFSFKICLKHEVSQCSIYRRAIGRPKFITCFTCYYKADTTPPPTGGYIRRHICTYCKTGNPFRINNREGLHYTVLIGEINSDVIGEFFRGNCSTSQ